ncbi:MAG TPA: haloalkane dehalogenase [Mycobacteriales bacterium]|jgi:haloalkane dehalogenase|nr:haloalkane dehalogenase [Mycobacteriales bacterium]
MEVRRTPDDRFAGLPDWTFAPRYVEVEGLRLARVDEGAGDPVVLLHGEPTWSFLYRRVVPPLVGAGLRVVAPDLVGFGRSDKPDDPGWYTYDRHVDLLTRHLAALDLARVTLVVQDWGGPIGLRWAMAHPDLVARIVILDTGLFSGREASAGLDAWLAYARAQTDLDVGALLDRACGGLPPEVVAGYDAPFPDVTFKAGALAFPRLVPTRMDDPGAAEQLATREALDAWDGPVQVAFADADPIFPAAVGEAWTRRLRHADPFLLIEGAGHFVQEMRPDAVAAAILGHVGRHPF